MKAKIRKDKKIGETRVEYFRVTDQSKFRYSLLKKIFADIDKDITILVDTNQRIGQDPIEGIAKFLEHSSLHYSIMPIEKSSNKLFGIKTNMFAKKKNKKKESLFVMEISPNQFTQELFQTCFKNYDMAIGIGNKKSFKEICDIVRLGFTGDVLFTKEYFEQSIYDSIICAMFRCSYDIEKYVGEVEYDNKRLNRR